ncbi:MAG: hypothetical protein J7M38_15295 [Armatimonadetes bacterium]|nr:hypothetical protein [Armatimonadota bacterium]
MKFRMTVLYAAMLALAAIPSSARGTMNLCPNPGAEEQGEEGRHAAWGGSFDISEWATDEVHSGARSLKLSAEEEGTRVWTSDMIPLPRPGCQLAVTVWAKFEDVAGAGGAQLIIYHTDEAGEHIGASGGATLTPARTSGVTRDWRQYATFSELTPETRGVRVNLRLNHARGTG